MREIKFRAWNKLYKRMIEFVGAINFLDGKVFDASNLYSRDLKYIDLMQYTGLRDKNGKEIYEGDIISADFDGEGMLFEVAWNNNAMAWDIKDKNGVFYFDIYENGSPFKFLKNIKVIGNIYENPELLKGWE